MKAMKWSAGDLESTVNRPEMENSFLMKKNEEFVSCSPQTTTNDGRITEKLHEHIPRAYLRFALNVEKVIVRYRSRKRYEQISLISELGRDCKRKSERVKKMGTRREKGTLFALSSLPLECNLYTEHVPSIGSAYQYLRKIVLHEVFRRKWIPLFSTNEFTLQVFKIIWNSTAQKEKTEQSLAGCNSVRNFRARDKLFQTLGYECSVSRYSTKSEEDLVRKEVQIAVVCREIMKTSADNDILRFSW